MPDSARFEGLAEALRTADATRKRDGHSVDLEESVEGSDDENPSANATASPAFPFDETVAHSIYVRPETLDFVADVEALVDARLRTEHDVRNLTTREFYDAILQTAGADPDALLRKILETRAGTSEPAP